MGMNELTSWLPVILRFADQATALAIGVFRTEGCAEYLNTGMRYLLGENNQAPAEAFVVPTFDSLQHHEAPEERIYQGWLTFGSAHTPHRSVRGEIHRRHNSLLVIAEFDVEDLERINHELMQVNREITNLQRELARGKAELAHLNELKNEFMGIAAHDLRSPLSVIQGFASLLVRRPDIPADERAELLAMIMESVRDMLNMLNNLLNVSEIESGKLNLHPQQVDMYDYMARIANLNRHLAEQKNITLTLDLESGLPLVSFDPDRIQQVMNNLLSNAFKFSHGGTTVTIRVAKSQPDAIEVSVIDQGQGIKADELNKVFRAFQRTSTQATAGEHSTGLGLAICKRIIELSGGRIGVESVYGTGSRFYFFLPLT